MEGGIVNGNSKDHRMREQLLEENRSLRQRLEEAEQTIEAIRHGDVDALVVAGPQGEQVFSITGAEHIYRVLVETMNEAGLMVDPDGTILFCNQRFCDLMKAPIQEVMGRRVTAFAARPQLPTLKAMLADGRTRAIQRRMTLQAADGAAVPVQISASPLRMNDATSICLVATDLTELEASANSIRVLREHQQAVEESEARFRAIFDSTQDAIVIVDNEGICRQANPAAKAVFGLPSEDLVGSRIVDFLFTDVEAPSAWRTFLTDGSFRGEASVKGFNGQIRYVESSAVAHILPGRHLFVVRDITERQQARESLLSANEQLQIQAEELKAQTEELQVANEEINAREEELRSINEELRWSESRYRELVQNANSAILRWKRDGTITFFNEYAQAFFGYNENEAIGKPVSCLLPERDSRGTDPRALVQGIMDHPERYVNHVNENVRRDGSRVWMAWTNKPIFDANGQLTEVLAVGVDITERKQAEEALARQNALLQGVNRTLQVALATDTDEEFGQACLDIAQTVTGSEISFIGEIGPDGRLHDLAISNPGWNACKMYDQAGHRKPPSDFPIRGIYGRVLADARSLIVNSPGTYPDSTGLPQGHPPLHNFLGVPLMREGVVVGLVAVGNHPGGYRIEDQHALEALAPAIVEALYRKRAEAALRELNATLETKVAQRTEELEYRAGQLQRLTLELSEAEDRERRRIAEILHDDLQQILAAAKFHLNLIRNRIKYDPSLQATGVQIDHMLKDAIDKSRALSHELSPAVLHHGDFTEILVWLAGQIQAKHGLLVHVDSSNRVELPSDALKSFLYKAAQELLFNVVKHARTNEARIRVRRQGGYICLSVSDRGRGFDPRELRQTAGFGLFSLRERVGLLGGRMKIKSVQGRGSMFHITVPLGEPVVGETAPGRPPTDTTKEAAPAREEERRIRVLLADDHEIVREGLISLLGDEDGIDVVGEAANGREAVDLADRLRPDVVVMDVAMPLIDGDEATRQIKQHLPDTRIIALSMYEEHENIAKMLRAGAESYILKTAPSEELLAAIKGKSTATAPA